MRKRVLALLMCICMTLGTTNFNVSAKEENVNILEKAGDTYVLENYVTSLKDAQSIQRKNFDADIMDYSITVDSDVDWKNDVIKGIYLHTIDGPESVYCMPGMYYAYENNCKETLLKCANGKTYSKLTFNLSRYKEEFETFKSRREEMLEIKQKFLDSISEPKEMSDYDKVLGVLKYMGYVKYDYDAYYAGKAINDAYTTLVKGAGTCEGFSNSFCYLGKIAGLNCKVVTGKIEKGNHAWVAVNICGKWYELEPQRVLKPGLTQATYDVNLSMALFLNGTDNDRFGYEELNNNKFREELPVSKTDYVDYSGHDYSLGEIVWNGSEATFYKKCSVCGEYESDGIKQHESPKYYHYVDREYIGTACDVTKVSETKCGEGTVTKYEAEITVDGKKYTSENFVVDGECSHVADSSKDEIIKKATCTEDGTVRKTCETCGYEWTESIPATGHKYETYKESVDTCEEKSDTEVVKCSVCGEIKSNTVKMYYTSHDYEFKEHTKLPTCTEEGEDTYVCSKCGDTKTEKVAATGHGETELRNVKEGTCIKEGYTGDLYCRVCGELVSRGTVTYGEHNLVTGVVEDKYVVEDGMRFHVVKTQIYCTYCGKVKETYEEKEFVENVETETTTTRETTKSDVKPTTKALKVGKATVKSLTNTKGKKIKVRINKVSGAKGYQIKYATDKKFKNYKLKTTKKTTYTIKKLKKKKTYYVRVRAYAVSGSNTTYGKWSSIGKVKVKK